MITRLARFFQAHVLWLLLIAYALAAIVPAFGLAIRRTSLGELTVFHQTLHLSLPLIMLAMLLFIAGLGVQTDRLKHLTTKKSLLAMGLAASFLIPLAFVGITAALMRLWHDPMEVQPLLLGLALVAAMPIAGSSTAWTHIANGDMALSLGLVLVTTFLSPLITPAVLSAVSKLASGEYATALQHLATEGTGSFLWIGVVIPSAAGILVRLVLKEDKIEAANPCLKLTSSVILLLLNYSNASISLPQLLDNPDTDFLLITVSSALALCLMAFGSAFWLSRLLQTDAAQEAALMYGLGMNNNGAGLVLASLSLASFPRVMAPIIVYNLIQHVIAGAVQFLRYRPREKPTEDRAG